MSVRLREDQESLQQKDIKFFDEGAQIEKKQKNAERRRLLKLSGFIVLGTIATGTGISYVISANNEKRLLEMKELKSSKKVDEVLKNLKSLKDQSMKFNIDSTSRIAELTKEMQLASMFNFNTNISNIEKSRVEAIKSFQVEYETVERNMQSLKRILENSDDEGLSKSMGTLNSLKKTLVELDKGFANPEQASKNSNQLIFDHFDSLKSLSKNILEVEQGLKDIKEEVVATILLKVKSGDYNLSATSSALVQDIKEFSKEKDQEILGLYNEIKGSEFEKDFNQNDIIEARKSVTELENSIVQKVLDDQNAVEKLISKVSNGQELKSGDLPAQVAAAAPTAPATTNHIVLKASDDMRFDKTEFTVKAGEEVTLIFMNTGEMSKEAMGHNFILLKPGVDASSFANEAVSAKATDYIPTALKNEILANTKLLGGGENEQIKFTLEAGSYDFLCSFPGHFATMNGKIKAVN